MLATKRPRLSHRHCPHCNKVLNVKTFKDHKRLFFDRDTKSWHKAANPSNEAGKELEITSLLSFSDDNDDGPCEECSGQQEIEPLFDDNYSPEDHENPSSENYTKGE